MPSAEFRRGDLVELHVSVIHDCGLPAYRGSAYKDRWRDPYKALEPHANIPKVDAV